MPTAPPSFRLLGPVRVVRGAEPVGIPGTLPRALLAVLALEPGRPVGLDRIAELLWGSEAPAGVKAAVQQLASRVRRALAPTSFAAAVRSVAPGYVLDVDPSVVDLAVFRASARAAQDAARAGDSETVVRTADAALSFWVGRALEDLADVPVGWQFGPFLDAERWDLEELRASALLALGRGGDAVERLVAATVAEPLRERLWVLLATALLETGRPTEAVRVVHAANAALATGLGVAPGPALVEIARRIEEGRASAPLSSDPASARRVMLHQVEQRAFDDAAARAELARAQGAFASAVFHWSHALGLLDVSKQDDERRLLALLGLGHACNEAGDAVRARGAFLEAAGIARRRGDVVSLARAALGYCADHVGFDQPARQAELLEEAVSALPPEEHALRSRLLGRLAREQYLAVSADRCRELAELALTEALAVDDDDARLDARYSLAFGYWSPDGSSRLVELCADYLDDALACGDRRHELLARRWLAHAVTEFGDVGRGEREAAAAIAIADDLGSASQRWMTRVIAAAQQIVVGDLTTAEHLADEALAIGSVAEPGPSLEYVSVLLWNLRWLQGRLDEIALLVEEIASAPGVELPRRLGLALTYAELGQLDAARAILDDVGADQIAAMSMDASWYVGMAALAEAAALTGHEVAARVALRRLHPFRGRIGISNMVATGPITHQIGLCRWVLGEHEAALADLAEAADFSRRVGAAVFAARSCAALAVRLHAAGQRDEASDVARVAADDAERLGLLGLRRHLASSAGW